MIGNKNIVHRQACSFYCFSQLKECTINKSYGFSRLWGIRPIRMASMVYLRQVEADKMRPAIFRQLQPVDYHLNAFPYWNKFIIPVIICGQYTLNRSFRTNPIKAGGK